MVMMPVRFRLVRLPQIDLVSEDQELQTPMNLQNYLEHLRNSYIQDTVIE